MNDDQIQPACPACGNHDVQEIARIEALYSIEAIDFTEGDDPEKCSCEYTDSRYSDDGEFVGYECRDCHHETTHLGEFIEGTERHALAHRLAEEAKAEAADMSTSDGLGADRVRPDGPETSRGGLIGQGGY